METKYCKNCKKERPELLFGVDNSKADKLQPYCKFCTRSKARKRHAMRRENIKTEKQYDKYMKKIKPIREETVKNILSDKKRASKYYGVLGWDRTIANVSMFDNKYIDELVEFEITTRRVVNHYMHHRDIQNKKDLIHYIKKTWGKTGINILADYGYIRVKEN